MTYQMQNTESPLRDRRRPSIKAVERKPSSAATYCLTKDLADAIRTLMQFESYRPELHYMRGPGPKWHAKRDHAFASSGIGGLRDDKRIWRVRRLSCLED